MSQGTVPTTSIGENAEVQDRQEICISDNQLSTERAEKIYNSLPLIDPELRGLLHGDRTTPELTIIERQRITDFAQTEALRLVAEGVVPNSLKFPVNVISVANSLGVSVKQVRIKDKTPQDHPIAGIITKKAGEAGATILVSIENSVDRMRFTVAHELAHYVTWRREISPSRWLEYRGSDTRSVEEGDTDPIQFCANTFAHNFLIPNYALATKLQEGPSIEQLAGIFGVSETGMRRRMTYFDLMTQTYPTDTLV